MDAQTPVGANGLAVHPDGDVYVDNLNAGSVMRVPVADDRSAGEVEQVVQDEGLVGADGMTIDEDGTLYVAVNAANEVVRVTDDQEIETLAGGDPSISPRTSTSGPPRKPRRRCTSRTSPTDLPRGRDGRRTKPRESRCRNSRLLPETAGETPDTDEEGRQR